MVIVNLSTKPMHGSPQAEAPCGVDPSEHPSLSEVSVVRCDYARIRSRTQLTEAYRKGLLQATRPAPPALVRKIQTALGASAHTLREVKELLRNQGLI